MLKRWLHNKGNINDSPLPSGMDGLEAKNGLSSCVGEEEGVTGRQLMNHESRGVTAPVFS